MKYIIDIPEKLIFLMEAKQGSVNKYIETVLTDPLIAEYRQKTLDELYAPRVVELNQELKQIKKDITIKVKETVVSTPATEKPVADTTAVPTGD